MPADARVCHRLFLASLERTLMVGEGKKMKVTKKTLVKKKKSVREVGLNAEPEA